VAGGNPVQGQVGLVSVIATADNTVVATIPIDPQVSGTAQDVAITHDGKFAYVTNRGFIPPFPGTVSMIGTGSNKVVATIPVGNGPQGVAITPR
jgi:YVTN family beta-propeller protein